MQQRDPENTAKQKIREGNSKEMSKGWGGGEGEM